MLNNEARELLIQALERSHNVREVARNYAAIIKDQVDIDFVHLEIA